MIVYYLVKYSCIYIIIYLHKDKYKGKIDRWAEL